MTIIGFTGTETGMTENQKAVVASLLDLYKPEEVHHGDCVGADTDFHIIASKKGFRIIGHPASGVGEKRAFNTGFYFIHDPKPPLERNKGIVQASTTVIATPREQREVLRSGTWATIRYTRKADVKLNIIYPDGTIEGITI